MTWDLSSYNVQAYDTFYQRFVYHYECERNMNILKFSKEFVSHAKKLFEWDWKGGVVYCVTQCNVLDQFDKLCPKDRREGAGLCY
jgi:hypothetical protein